MESTEAKVRHLLFVSVDEVKPSMPGYEWVHFYGSRESMSFPVGSFAKGDKVKITFEKE